MSFTYLIALYSKIAENFPIWLGLFRLVRLITFLRLPELIKVTDFLMLKMIDNFNFQRTLPWLSLKLNKIIIRKIALGYDIGKSYILGIDEVLKLLPMSVTNLEASAIFQMNLEEELRAAYNEIGD